MPKNDTSPAHNAVPETSEYAWAADLGAACYALEIQVGAYGGERKRRGKGVAVGPERLYWNAGSDVSRSYGQIARISLSSYDKAEGSGGFCRIEFVDSLLVTVSSGLHAGAKSAEREATYDTFLRELHARLQQVDRQRIVFQDGVSVPTSGIVIGTVTAAAIGFIPAAIAAFVGNPAAVAALVFGLLAGGLTFLRLLSAQGKTDGRRYDPDALPAHTLFGVPGGG